MYDFHNIALTPTQAFLLNAGILSVIVLALLRSERKLDDSNPLAMLAILAVFGIGGRVLLEPLPNIQPVTVIVLLAGIYYGAPRALALAGIIALVSTSLSSATALGRYFRWLDGELSALLALCSPTDF